MRASTARDGCVRLAWEGSELAFQFCVWAEALRQRRGVWGRRREERLVDAEERYKVW